MTDLDRLGYELEPAPKRDRCPDANDTIPDTTLRTTGAKRGLLRQFAESGGMMFWVMDCQNQKALHVTATFVDLFEQCWFRQCRDSASFWEIVHHEDRARVREAISLQMDKGRSEVEFRVVRVDGSARWLWSRAFSITTGDGKLARHLGIVLDVTDRKQKELGQLSHLQEEVRQSQKMASLGRLAGGVAHDFNNLLTVINGYSELMIANPTSPEAAKELAGEIHKAGERAVSLTRQLLAFSRKQVLEPRVIDLNVIVADSQKILRRILDENIELAIGLDPALDPVKVDAGQVEQALLNIVVNARDAMPHGGKVIIKTANVVLNETSRSGRSGTGGAPGRFVLLAVTDNGYGMDARTSERIFEPFFTTKEPGMGTGLGLAMVNDFVEASGGHVTVQSELGRGTTISLYLPHSHAVAPSAATPEVRATHGGTETILLAEDDDGVRSIAHRALQHYGYRVLVAADGDQALRLAQRFHGRVDLLVTDVMMPELDGCKLAGRLIAFRPRIKTLFVSGYPNAPLVRHGVVETDAAFLRKPFTLNALASKVREVLDESAK